MSGDRMSGSGWEVYLSCIDFILLPNAPFPKAPPTRRQNSMWKGPGELRKSMKPSCKGQRVQVECWRRVFKDNRGNLGHY